MLRDLSLLTDEGGNTGFKAQRDTPNVCLIKKKMWRDTSLRVNKATMLNCPPGSTQRAGKARELKAALGELHIV